MNNFKSTIFSIDSEEKFNATALAIFEYQYKNISVYRQFVEQFSKRSKPIHYSEIPFLPISFFKTHKIIKEDMVEELLFKSSGTTGQIRSQHFVADASVYQTSFLKAYHLLIGNPADHVVLALLPNYIEQGHSSLVYMVDHLIQQTNNPLSGFLLNQPEKIKEHYQQSIQQQKKIIIFGVSYALLDLAEKQLDLSQATIIETGGMKGRRKELSKEELHELLKKGLNVSYISSEYGMTELLSQAYSNKEGLFSSPPWLKILIRDVNDPFNYVQEGKSGGINVIDLANFNSCSFIATEDLGKKEGDLFKILGRIDLSDIRGCNLLIQ
ncbi:MAG: acyl transferase [Crocinitomicaceae bacterium]|nr:acyl transferase [Crocinitomicaceae bacterium]